MKRELLYPEITVRRAPPLGYDDPAFHLSFLRLEERAEPCYVRELRNALVAPSGLVFKGGRIVPESVHTFNPPRPGTFYKKLVLGRVRQAPDKCFVVHHRLHLNYYHWTTEMLPRIYCIRDRIRDRFLLLGDESRVWQTESLRYFEFAGVVHIGRLELARTENLLVPQPLGRFPVYNEQVLREMGAWYRERTPWNGSEFADCRNLFIMREPGKTRNLVNQAEVIELLTRYGFKAVCLEPLSIPRQVNLFRNVRNLVSVHGAGMSNMIFMEPGGAVIDLINEHHRDASFFNLACAGGHRQVVLQCATAGDIHRKAAIYDIAVDLDRLRHYLERCMV